MAEETETVAKSVMLERLAAKDRAHSAAVQLLEAKISKLSDKMTAAETVATDAAAAIAERDQLRDRLQAADIAAALGGVGLGGDENDGLRSAIIERWKTAPVEADAGRRSRRGYPKPHQRIRWFLFIYADRPTRPIRSCPGTMRRRPVPRFRERRPLH